MANEKKARKKLARKLQEAQAEHAALLKRLEKARTKLQKRGQDLRVLETQMAELERAFYMPNAANPEQAAKDNVKLRHARLIYKPKTGTLGNDVPSLEEIVTALRTHGIEASVTVRTSGKVVVASAREAAERGEDLVIVAGGDGTIEKAAAQLVGTETILGIIPNGTMNNLARCLGIPLQLNDACALIGMGVVRKIDVGRVNVNEAPHVKYFLETAGLGLSALAFAMGQNAKKGRWSGMTDALGKLLRMKPTPVLVELDDGQTIQANAQVVTASNAPLIGLNFLIAPEAKMDDGLLDIAIYDEMGKTEFMGYMMAARNAHHVDNPKIKKFKSQRVRMFPRDPEPVASDKELIPEKANLEIQLLPQALNVIVGKGFALTLPVDVAPSVPPLSGPQPSNGHDAVAETKSIDEAAKIEPNQ